MASHPHFDGRRLGPRPGELVAVFAGGALGTLLRAGLADVLPPEPGRLPWATLMVNVAGAALLGWWVARPAGGRVARSFVAAGVLGALTTFSALQLELLELLDAGRTALAAAYAGLSLVAGLGALVAAGRLAGRSGERA
jgi:fluoride exporter